MIDRAAERRRRLNRRALPALGGLGLLALGAGIAVGSLAPSSDEQAARSFARAWERRDYSAMYALLAGRSRSRYDRAAFERAYEKARRTATVTGIRAQPTAGEQDGAVRVPVDVRTRLFGTLRGELLVPVVDGDVDWAPHLVFPELPEGVPLTRRTEPPKRAKLLARDGKVLAEGEAGERSSPLGPVGYSIAGQLAPERTVRGRREVYARGFARTMPIGQTGLERVFERELAGRPGAELLAGKRVLARSRPRPGRPIRTTIDVGLQRAAVAALAGRLGGVAALDARTGEIRALAGIAMSGAQPPGSTFKIVTTTAALEAGAVELSTEFPVRTEALIDGVPLENANGESCGGTFRISFAHSCNSVFAPLGVKLGARRLVDAAERYGFNERPTLPGLAPSTLPPASDIRTPLEVGATAIGQGRVLATALELASMAQAVGRRGVRVEPTLRAGARRTRRRVTSPRIAATLRRLMVDVVAYGTGTAAGLPGVRVAGKTGTAELEDTRGPNAVTQRPASDPTKTDAWFTSFAPAARPKIAVSVMLVRAGAGGQTAAPAARLVLQSALG